MSKFIKFTLRNFHRISPLTNLDYKDKYKEKNKELIQNKVEFIEALDSLRKETSSRENFELQYKTVETILDEEDIKRQEEATFETEVDKNDVSSSDFDFESEIKYDNNSDQEIDLRAMETQVENMLEHHLGIKRKLQNTISVIHVVKSLKMNKRLKRAQMKKHREPVTECEGES